MPQLAPRHATSEPASLTSGKAAKGQKKLRLDADISRRSGKKVSFMVSKQELQFINDARTAFRDGVGYADFFLELIQEHLDRQQNPPPLQSGPEPETQARLELIEATLARMENANEAHIRNADTAFAQSLSQLKVVSSQVGAIVNTSRDASKRIEDLGTLSQAELEIAEKQTVQLNRLADNLRQLVDALSPNRIPASRKGLN